MQSVVFGFECFVFVDCESLMCFFGSGFGCFGSVLVRVWVFGVGLCVVWGVLGCFGWRVVEFGVPIHLFLFCVVLLRLCFVRICVVCLNGLLFVGFEVWFCVCCQGVVMFVLLVVVFCRVCWLMVHAKCCFWF